MVERTRKTIAGEMLAAGSLRPLLENDIGRTEARLPVHCRATANASASKKRHAEIRRSRRASIQIQLTSTCRFVLIEFTILPVTAGFDHDHLFAGLSKPGSHDAAARTGADNADIAFEASCPVETLNSYCVGSRGLIPAR
jgi:hypothetical protein